MRFGGSQINSKPEWFGGSSGLGAVCINTDQREAAKSKIPWSSPGKKRQITAVNRICAPYKNTDTFLCLSAQNPSNSICCINLMY